MFSRDRYAGFVTVRIQPWIRKPPNRAYEAPNSDRRRQGDQTLPIFRLGAGNLSIRNVLALANYPKQSKMAFNVQTVSRSARIKSRGVARSMRYHASDLVPKTFKRHPDQLASSAYLRFSKELLKRIFDDALRELHLRRNLLIRKSLNNQAEHL